MGMGIDSRLVLKFDQIRVIVVLRALHATVGKAGV